MRCTKAPSIMLLIAALALSCGVGAWAEEGWRLRMIDDKGFDDPWNVGVGRLAPFGDYLYLGTWNAKNGNKMYRSKDGETWQWISTGGLGSVNNFSIVSIAWFKGKLYVGTWNDADGAAMFRGQADAEDPADVVWEEITDDGFGNPRNKGFTHMRVFKDHIYTGCFNLREGPEVWRSATGDPGDWNMVIPKGFGAKSNSDATMMVIHDGYLYIGTESARAFNKVGCQLWRTDGNLAPPYDQWEQVNADGFGNPRNHNICGLGMLGGKMYAGTWNWTQGLEVWRATPSKTVPFSDWEKVNENGFGEQKNNTTACIAVLGDTLFLGGIGAFVPEGNLLSAEAKVKSAHGGILVKTTDGTTWEEVDQPGFMESPMIGVQWIAPFHGSLYIGGQSLGHPMELWVYEPVN